MSEDPIPYTPVKTYRRLSRAEIDDMNNLKELEATVLQAVALLRDATAYDPRWIAIGATHIELGFMALNRAVARPEAIVASAQEDEEGAQDFRLGGVDGTISPDGQFDPIG